MQTSLPTCYTPFSPCSKFVYYQDERLYTDAVFDATQQAAASVSCWWIVGFCILYLKEYFPIIWKYFTVWDSLRNPCSRPPTPPANPMHWNKVVGGVKWRVCQDMSFLEPRGSNHVIKKIRRPGKRYPRARGCLVERGDSYNPPQHEKVWYVLDLCTL